MAQVDCVQNINSDTLDDSDGCTVSKRMKQARLPFKAIDHKSQIVSPKSTASKKRKLSDSESPSAKAAKTPKSCTNTEKNQITSNETEVSSSSEADNVKIRVRNTLERFVRKSSQEEITSSTNNDCIDLTDTDEGKESDQSFVDMNTCQSKNIKEFFSVLSKETSKNSDEERVENYVKVIEEVSKGIISSENSDKQEESLGKTDDSHNLRENKENMDISIDSTNSSDLNNSAIDPVTPGKGTVPPTVFKTPVSSNKSPQSVTPTSQSPGDSFSDGTPKSAKKPRSKLSEAKLKEREAARQKIKEEKQKALEEKKRQKEQERLEKEKQRQEKEAMKAEKEKQKKEEKEKKEKERLEKVQQKEEELKKKREEQEAKMEEKRKKEEEKRIKEEGKLKENEEKLKKEQKIKQAFQSFFIKTNTSPTSSKVVKEPSGLFMPFQVKENTRLAPEHRKTVTDDEREKLDSLMVEQSCSKLYLTELKKGKEVGKSGKTYPKILGDDDVELLVHDSEVVKKVTYKCKLLQFHMNYRPPYYGTWRKNSCNLSPRNPFKTDTELLDYEYDSDDDWEEEEPGESLSDCEDDDEKDEDVKEEEDGWMVPHGYLSEDEGVDEDEEVTPEVIEMRRKSKAEQWESELKRQTKAVLPQIIGCVWEQATQVLQEEIKKQLEDYRAVFLTSDPVPTSFSEPLKPVKGDNNAADNVDTPKVNSQKKPVPEEAMPDLIRLVHGNLMGIKKLIQEFRIYWKSKMTGEQVPTSIADMSMEVEDTDNKVANTSLCQEASHNKSINLETESDETDCSISKRQLEIRINSIAVREKRPDYKKNCWYVNDDVLKQYNCEGLPIPSAWESVIQPTKTPAKPKPEESQNMLSGRKTPVPSIAQFARPMSPSTIAAQHAAAQAKILAEKKKETEGNQSEKMDTSDVTPDSVTPQKESKKFPADQRKLTDFTKTFTSPKCQKPVATNLCNLAASVESSPDIPDTTTITTSPSSANIENDANSLSVECVKKCDKHIDSQSSKVIPVNGLLREPTGEDSRDAIVLD